MCVADPAEGAHDFHFVHTLLYVLHKLIFGASDAPPPLFFIFSLVTCFLSSFSFGLFHKKTNLLPIPRAVKVIHRLKSTMTCVKWGHLSPRSREWCSLLGCLISIYSKFPALKLTEEIQKGISGPRSMRGEDKRALNVCWFFSAAHSQCSVEVTNTEAAHILLHLISSLSACRSLNESVAE